MATPSGIGSLLTIPSLGKSRSVGGRHCSSSAIPPPQLLPEMAHKNLMFTVKHALAAPLLRISKAEAVELASGVFRIDATVENHGYLPTNVTDRAVAMKAVDPCTVSLELPDGVELVSGTITVDVDHLAGWSDRSDEYTRFSEWSAPARGAQWVVRTPLNHTPTVRIVARSTRAGTIERELDLR